MVPPGLVTIARSDSADSPVSVSRRADAEQGLVRERSAHVARQPGEHAGLGQRLGHEEHVGRARARQPGDGVEQVLRDANDRPDRGEDRLGPLEVAIVCM